MGGQRPAGGSVPCRAQVRMSSVHNQAGRGLSLQPCRGSHQLSALMQHQAAVGQEARDGANLCVHVCTRARMSI